MLHARVLDEYIHFSVMCTTHNIFLVLPINNLVNQYGEPTTPQKLQTSMKPSVSNIHVLFYPCVVRKTTTHVDGKSLNMRHQSQKWFWDIFVGIPQQQEGCLVYVHSTQK